MANVLGVVWTVVGWILTQVGAMLLIGLLFPNPVRRAERRILERPGRSFAAGLLFWVVSAFLTISLLQAKAAPAQILGWLCAGPMLACSIFGGAALARLAGSRIREEAPHAPRLLCVLGGALCVTLAGLLPVIGWFVILPLSGFTAVGAGLWALAPGRRRISLPEFQASGAETGAPVIEISLPKPGNAGVPPASGTHGNWEGDTRFQKSGG